ncbi:MAG TPA: polyprenol monophosphomannose synthase [bacterium]|nr:polyprenol monophosphomannose synthase [bacterium]
MPRTIVTVPTYNEAENIGELIDQLRRLDVEVLVADDNSPDGTWQIVAARAKTDPGVHLLHRTTNKGRGYAGAEAFCRALELGADFIGEMDADFSHQPKFVPALAAALANGADIALGSRHVPGGEDLGRPWYRLALTRFSCWYARKVLGMSVRDINTGFRFYTRAALEKIAPATLISAGPSIVHEIMARAKIHRLRIVEVPITFIQRQRGTSELTFGRLLDGFFKVWRVKRLTRRKTSDS